MSLRRSFGLFFCTSLIVVSIGLITSCGPPTLSSGRYIVFDPEGDSDGWHPMIFLQVEDDSVVDSRFDYVNRRMEARSEQNAWESRFESAYGIGARDVTPDLLEQLAEEREVDLTGHSFQGTFLRDFERLATAVLDVAADGTEGEQQIHRLEQGETARIDRARLDDDTDRLVRALEEVVADDSAVRQRRAHRGGVLTPPSRGGRAAVSQHTLATDAGMEVLERGGTAADAAFAMSAVLSVVEPTLSSVFGGGTWLLYYDAAADEVVTIGGVGPAPEAATIERFQDDEYFDRDGIHRSIVPGAWAGWMELLREYGRTSLAELIEPARNIAAEGHELTEITRLYLGPRENLIREWPHAGEIYLDGDELLSAGDTIRHPNMADTFDAVAREYTDTRGRGEIAALNAAEDYFYRGPIAEQIARFSRDNDGLLTYSDFSNYEGARVREPLRLDYRGYDVYQNPPDSQGIVMLQALGILEEFDFTGLEPHSPDTVHLQAEALKLGFQDRERYIGDPAFVDIDVERLLSRDYLSERAGSISMNQAMSWPMDDVAEDAEPAGRATPAVVSVPGSAEPGRIAVADFPAKAVEPSEANRLGGPGSPGDAPAGGAIAVAGSPAGGPIASDSATGKPTHTTTLHAVDEYGNVAAVTTSIGISVLVAGETGIHMNERLTFMSNDPDHPNAIEPGKRVRHTSMPYLVKRDGAPYIAGGNTGADFQPQGQLQQLMSIVDFGLSAQEAIDLPRFDVRTFPSTIYPYNVRNQLLVESGFPDHVRDALATRGHTVRTGTYWGHATAIVIDDHESGDMETGAEPREVDASGLVQ